MPDPRTLLHVYADESCTHLAVDDHSAGYAREEFTPEAIAALWAALELHKPFHIYDECDHGDGEEHTGTVVEVDDIGPSCDDGYQYSICRECCTHNGYQTQECATEHIAEGECWPCPTANAITTAIQGGQQ